MIPVWRGFPLNIAQGNFIGSKSPDASHTYTFRSLDPTTISMSPSLSKSPNAGEDRTLSPVNMGEPLKNDPSECRMYTFESLEPITMSKTPFPSISPIAGEDKIQLPVITGHPDINDPL